MAVAMLQFYQMMNTMVVERYIGKDEHVFICFDGPDKQVLQVTMFEFRRYYSLLGWTLMGPAAKMFDEGKVKQGQPTIWEQAYS